MLVAAQQRNTVSETAWIKSEIPLHIQADKYMSPAPTVRLHVICMSQEL